MNHIPDTIIGLIGLSVILCVIWDVFQSIIVPHYRSSSFRLSPILVSRILWLPVRWFASRFAGKAVSHHALTLFAPGAMMVLLACWLSSLTLGYSLILWTQRAHISPHLQNINDAVYFAASSVLTIGFGDVVACTLLSRITVICSAITGIVFLALMVSFLFSAQSHFHGREVNAQIIAARSQHSCNGVLLYQAISNRADALAILELCERWLVDTYQSHTAYPLLLYFRSRSSRTSWLSQLGAVLDASALLLTIGPEEYKDIAQSIYDTGCRALAVFVNHWTLPHKPSSPETEPTDRIALFQSLSAQDPASAARLFAAYREVYMTDLHGLCEFFLIPPPQLSLPHATARTTGTLSASAQQKRVAPGMTGYFHVSGTHSAR